MPKIHSLQLLRAFAAISVLIGHCLAEAQHFFATDFALLALPFTRGVDIFFVISGFIITLSGQRFTAHPWAFLWRRFWRVAPLYYLFTTLMVIVLFALPGGVKDTHLDIGQILSSYSFLPYARADGRIAPVLSLGWTLNYEMFFYAIFAIGLALHRPVWFSTIVMLLLCVSGVVFSFSTTFWSHISNPIILEFIFGIGLAHLYLSARFSPNMLHAAALFVLGMGLMIALHFTTLPRVVGAGIPAMLIVASGCIFAPGFGPRLQIFGDSSYALYLSHRFSLRAATVVFAPSLLTLPYGAVFYVIATSILSLSVGILVHLYIERPLLAPPLLKVSV